MIKNTKFSNLIEHVRDVFFIIKINLCKKYLENKIMNVLNLNKKVFLRLSFF